MSGISLTTKWSAADVTVVKSVACWQNPTSLIWQKLSDLGDNVRSWHCAEWWHYSDREYIRYTDNEIMSWCTSGSITTCSLLGKTQFSNIQHHFIWCFSKGIMRSVIKNNFSHYLKETKSLKYGPKPSNSTLEMQSGNIRYLSMTSYIWHDDTLIWNCGEFWSMAERELMINVANVWWKEGSITMWQLIYHH